MIQMTNKPEEIQDKPVITNFEEASLEAQEEVKGEETNA